MTDFDRFFLKYHHPVLLYTLKFIGDENEALDLVQDVFIAVWEKGQYRGNEEQVKAYMFTVMKNSCLNYIKHQKVVRKFEHHVALQLKEMEAIHYQSGEKSLIEKEELKSIVDFVASLSDIYREVIVLSRYKGLKNSEIADRLNIPVRTVETRIFRALSLLKERISRKSVFVLMYLNCFGKL